MNKLKTLFGRLITVTALFFVASFIIRNFQEINFTLSENFIFYFVISIATSSAFFLLRSIAWNKLIASHSHILSFQTTSWFLFSSEIIRYIPGNIWGLAARVVKAPQFGISKSTGFILLLEESMLLVVSAGLISGLGLLILPDLILLFHLIGAALLLSCGLLLGVPYFFQKKIQAFKFFRTVQFSRLHHPKVLIRLLPVYIFLWIFFGFSHYTLFCMIFPQISFTSIFFFSIISWLAGYASLITPSGLGVRELVFGIGLGTTVALGIANAFALVARIWYVLLEIVWYVIFFLLYKRFQTNTIRP